VNVGLALTCVSVTFGALGFWINWRRTERERSADHFVRVIRYVRDNYAQLNARALAAQSDSRADGLPMLERPSWVLNRPVPLDRVRLTRETSANSSQFDQAREHARHLMPRRAGGSRYASYSQAVTELGGMGHLYNGSTYRIVDIAVCDDEIQLTCVNGRYFNHLDTTLVLTYEAAKRDLGGRNLLHGRYRRYLKNPFDLRRRASGLGVNTLTIRQDTDSAGFYLHHRNGSFVAEGPDSIHVVPAGEFTPSDVGLQAFEDDFDLWRNIMREYAEEFLDVEEAYGRGGSPLDYVNQWPFKEFQEARQNGGLRIYVLGIGLDPLDWKPGLLTVCIFEAETFDRIFKSMIPNGKEGVIVAGPHRLGIPFNEKSVRRYTENPNMINSGASCLKLAWRHRVELKIVRPQT
jgi:hypothetical protein